MNAENIRQLIARGESETLELKKSLSQLRRGVETVTAMANTRGGQVLFGVQAEGKIIGLEHPDASAQIAEAITKNTDPILYPSLETVEIGGKKIVVVAVVESEDKPHFAYGHGYLRVGSTTKIMSRAVLEMAISQRRPAEFERRPALGAAFSDLDEDKLRIYFRLRAPGAEDVDHLSLAELAVGQGLAVRVNGDHRPSVAGLLLFGKLPQKINDNWGITALRVHGPDITYPIIDRREITGAAEQLIERGLQFVAGHMRVAYDFPKDSIQRREIPEYPLTAVREALVNAVAHRDYQPNERIQLRLHDDRLEIQNPGGLLPGLKLEQVLRTPTPRRRNFIIAQVLLEWKLAEQVGRGLVRIQRDMRELGAPEPRFESTSSHFIVTLPSRHQLLA